MQMSKQQTGKVRWMIRGDAYAVSRISKEQFRELSLSSREVVIAIKQKKTIGTVVEHEERIIGYLLMDMTTNDYCDLFSFAIEQQYERQGYGTLILAHAEKVARNLGFSRIETVVPERKVASQLFLAANGFRYTKSLYKFEGDADDWYLFTKEIS